MDNNHLFSIILVVFIDLLGFAGALWMLFAGRILDGLVCWTV